MKHVMYGEKSLLMADESADVLIEYAGVVAETAGGDTVRMQAVGNDGNKVEVTFLLNAGTVLVVETATAAFDPPSNEEAVQYMRARMERVRNPPPAQSDERQGEFVSGFDEYA